MVVAAAGLRASLRGLVDDADCLSSIGIATYDLLDGDSHDGDESSSGKQSGAGDGRLHGLSERRSHAGVLRDLDESEGQALGHRIIALQRSLGEDEPGEALEADGNRIGQSVLFSSAIDVLAAWRHFRFTGASARVGAAARVLV